MALAGCSVATPKLDPPIAAQWQHVPAGQAAAPTDLHAWWMAFDDPVLNTLVDRALAHNLDVAQSVERLRAVRVMQERAGARYLPAIKASTQQAIDPDASSSFLVAGFDASWELGLFGRSQGTRNEAQGELDAGVATLQAARVSLVAEVVRNWIELRTAQHHEQLLTRIADARNRQLDLLRTRLRLQLASPSSVDQAMAAASQAQATAAISRQAINAAAQRLAVLLGQNHPDSAWFTAGRMPGLGAWRLPGTPADLLRTRPEIALAEADVLRAAGKLDLAHADRFPRIGFGASMIWATGLNSSRRATVSNGLASLGPIIDIPLFDWGMRKAAEQAKTHELNAALFAYRQAVLDGMAEVETALGALDAQRMRETQSVAALKALQRTADAMHARVKLKLESPLSLVDTGIAADQADIDVADAIASRNLAYVALFKALGGAPLPPGETPGNTTIGDAP